MSFSLEVKLFKGLADKFDDPRRFALGYGGLAHVEPARTEKLADH